MTDRARHARATSRAAATLLASVVLTVSTAFVSPAAAQPAPTTAPAAVSSAFADRPLNRPVAGGSNGSAGTSDDGPAGERGAVPAPAFGTTRTILSMAAVIGLILLVRVVGKRFFPSPGRGGSSRAVKVLAKTPVGPRQQVMLLQVGKRVLIVGDTGAHLSPLGEITDPDETAALIGQVTAERSDSIASTFGPLFGRAARTFQPEPKSAPPSRRARPGDGDPDDDADGIEPSLALSRAEMSGLMEKVRGMSQQYRSG